MADETESSPFNFSIENTSEMGSQELLDNFFETEQVSSKPEDIKKIDEVKKEVPKKEVPKTIKKEEEPAEKKEKTLAELLTKDDEEEEEEEQEEEIDETKKPEGPEVNTYKALAKDLLNLGVFTLDEDEEGELDVNTPEDFLARFNSEKVKGANEMLSNFLGQFGEPYQNAFQAIFVKGVDPKEYFETYNSIQNFADMDLTKESSQLAVVRQYFKDQGYEEAEDIEAEVERVKNNGDLEAVAQRHHKILIKKEAQKLQQMEENKERELQQKVASKQLFAKNVSTLLQEKIKTKDFDGLPINPKLASELQDFLVRDAYKTPSGEHLTEFDKFILDLKKPENHSMKVKVGLLLKTLEKDPTLSTIQKAAITKKTDSLFSEVSRASKGTKKSEPQEKPNTWQL